MSLLENRLQPLLFPGMNFSWNSGQHCISSSSWGWGDVTVGLQCDREVLPSLPHSPSGFSHRYKQVCSPYCVLIRSTWELWSYFPSCFFSHLEASTFCLFTNCWIQFYFFTGKIVNPTAHLDSVNHKRFFTWQGHNTWNIPSFLIPNQNSLYLKLHLAAFSWETSY